MQKKRIQQLADFFYSSDDAKDVPLRISVISGRYAGCNLTEEGFIELMTILNNSQNLKEDLAAFWNEVNQNA